MKIFYLAATVITSIAFTSCSKQPIAQLTRVEKNKIVYIYKSGVTVVNGMKVQDASSPLYKYPNNININDGRTLELYGETVSAMSFHSFEKDPAIMLIGGDATLSNHYPLAQDKSRYSLYGF